MSLNIRKVRANTHDPFSRRSRSPIYADHMARWKPQPRCRALLKAIARRLRFRNESSELSDGGGEQLSELETRDVHAR